MIINDYKIIKTYMGKIDYGCDLLDEINKICAKKNIQLGYVNLIGALQGLKIGYFKQDEKKYVYLDDIYSDKPFEIVSCAGNISLKDNKPFAHVHIVVSDRDGNCFGGHLMPGTIIYACEFMIQEFEGKKLYRGLDETTQLPLWRDE